jgi:hypothetical protein
MCVLVLGDDELFATRLGTLAAGQMQASPGALTKFIDMINGENVEGRHAGLCAFLNQLAACEEPIEQLEQVESVFAKVPDLMKGQTKLKNEAAQLQAELSAIYEELFAVSDQQVCALGAGKATLTNSK